MRPYWKRYSVFSVSVALVPVDFVYFLLSELPTPVQTDKLRKETNEDMSIAKAIAIVMDRNPHLRFVISNFCLSPAVSSNIPVI